MAAAGLGVLVLLTPTLDVFGLLNDSVEVNENTAVSGTYAGSHDLQAAQIELGDACDGEDFSDGPFTAVIDSATVDLNAAHGDVVATHEDQICLLNAGSEAGQIAVTIGKTTNTEVGCASSEDGFDSDCGSPGSGELQGATAPWLRFVPDVGSSCGGIVTAAPLDWRNRTVIDGDLAPGEFCVVQIQLRLNASDELALLMAQSDHLEWDMTFWLEDVPA